MTRRLALLVVAVIACLLLVSVASAQDTNIASEEAGNPVQLVVSALLWSTLSTVTSQVVSIIVVAMLGVAPRKIAHEIAEIQNPAIGACFLAIAIAASSFIAPLTSSGFTPDPDLLASVLWIVGGVLLGFTYTVIAIIIAHRVFGTKKDENFYQWMQREIVAEQNVSLALFIGSLLIPPFTAVSYQLI
jgi:hypothetical protein